jgi:hypothetical protein
MLCPSLPKSERMTKLHRLSDEKDQSPWLDNLTRTYLRDGTSVDFGDSLHILVCFEDQVVLTPDPW